VGSSPIKIAMIKVYTGGTFDLFHSGHVNLLKACKKIAGPNGMNIVSLNTDEFIEEYKGRKPICSYEERKTVLEGCKFVDVVIENIGGVDSKPAIEMANPDFIVIGTDWAVKDYYLQMGFTQEWLDQNDITLCYVPYTAGISTTDIKKRLS
jgi:glycerol-3-phosphate cytidylyltransferase